MTIAMGIPDDSGGLHPALREQVLDRLGLPGPPRTDLEGLAALYGAWCARVPFDNVRKMIALRSRPDGPLPGLGAQDFFEQWMAHGAGGTCWPTSNALFELARALGFEARRVAGSMRDLGVVNHASVKVRADGREWLVDSSQLTNVPLPLDDQVFVHDDPVFPAEVEPWTARTCSGPTRRRMRATCRAACSSIRPLAPRTSRATRRREPGARSTSASTSGGTGRASCWSSWGPRGSRERREGSTCVSSVPARPATRSVRMPACPTP